MAGPDATVDAFLGGRADEFVAGCAAGVLVDINVPTWRFQMQGRDALRELLAEQEFLPGREVVAWRSTSTGDGVLLECETHAPVHGERRLWRQVVWLRGTAGAWSEVVVFCTGIWDAATIARQALDAPMARP